MHQELFSTILEYYVYLWSKKRNFHSRLCLEVNSSLGSSTVHISYEHKKKNNVY